MSEPDEWNGDERRAIPVHVLTYIDVRLEKATAEIRELVMSHVEEEEARYAEILENIEANNAKSEKRHMALCQSINAYMERQQDIDAAFLEHAGQPDYAGHHAYHKSTKAQKEWLDNLKQKALVKVVEWLAVLVLGWIGITVWVAFLNGPKIGG